VRRRPRSDNFRSTRRSCTYYPVDSPELSERMTAAFPIDGFYTNLLYQDLGHVVPYSLGRDQGGRARLTGADAEKALPIVSAALSDGGYPSLEDGVRDFVSSTAQNLVFGGRCTYELAFLAPLQSETDEHPVGFEFPLVIPGTISTRDGAPIQYVLPSLSELRDRNGLAYVALDPDTLVEFTLPGELVAPVRRLIAFLQTANKEQGKEFGLMEQSVIKRTDYDFSAHKLERGELFAKVTQPVGWNVRDLFPDNQLEPYVTWRQIRFLEFQVKLRDRILDRLNYGIKLAGAKLGFETTIQLEGLPTHEDVEQAKEDFRTGRKGFPELLRLAI